MQTLFFYAPGSRYSYLAATQLASIEQCVNVKFDWRVVYSPDLIAASGGANPFTATNKRGQYSAAYRTQDATRWAAHFKISYKEPDFDSVDWKSIALWCAGAELQRNTFGAAALNAAFAFGAPLTSRASVETAAVDAGIDFQALSESVATDAAAHRLEENLALALSKGAFGVPSFVCADGALFWGQDRIPLLRDHLARLTD